eukprot:TRINITY_DN328_c0_g1_i1.p1 TRINITY_DN328_c0_g1~~TRINITY_DN328_c0_g1_i1.p1  ORF type:complete len:204 (+),score=59.34 TRINITY_DN328_c0_g1_i1:86-697(+)
MSVDVKKALSHEFPAVKVSYNRRDLILYALGVGSSDLRFIYEDDTDFAALPTYLVVLGFKGNSFDIVPFSSLADSFPGMEFDPSQILHGEEKVELFHPLPLQGDLFSKKKILAVYDKGKGAVVISENVFSNSAGVKIGRVQTSTFIRGLGGFGGDRGPNNEPIPIPKRAPDAVHEDKTDEKQAALYRLSGYVMILHSSSSYLF